MNSSATHLSYVDYVKLRAQSNPCIDGLDRYLQRSVARPSNVVYFDYSEIELPSSEFQPIKVGEDQIVKLFDNIPAATTRLVLIEDISPRLVTLIGNILDVDPIFFADYINTSFENIERAPPPPSLAILPSLLAQRGYLHLHYQQVLDMGIAETFGNTAYAFKTDSNVTRNIRRLAPLSGKQLALARASCSMLLRQLDTSSICLVLVDRPVSSVVENLGTQKQKSYAAKRLHGGFEDVATSHQSLNLTHDQHEWSRDSMLSSLVYYLRHQGIPRHSDKAMGITDFAYYPIRIALSEWNLYMHVISRYSKHYEYSLHDITSRLHGDDIVDLQRWRRRIRQSRHKLTLVTEFIEFWMQHEESQIVDQMVWKLVVRDINYLQGQFQDYKQSLEQMVTVATSMIQLLDSRRSILEAVNVRRLTYIALVFAPLAWVASLFSMSEDYSPGHDRFWVYFATALPLVFVIVLVSTFQWDQAEGLLEQVWKSLPILTSKPESSGGITSRV